MIFWFWSYFPNLIFKICFADSEQSIRGLRQPAEKLINIFTHPDILEFEKNLLNK